MTKNIRRLCIDPSINNMGIAVFNGKFVMHHELLHPDKETINDEWNKIFSLYQQLLTICRHWHVTEIVCEVPQHWQVGGFAARESGSLYKLSQVAGMVSVLRGPDGKDTRTFVHVFPAGWKKQIPKEVMVRRLRPWYLKQNIDLAELNHNVADAIGIGHWRIHGKV